MGSNGRFVADRFLSFVALPTAALVFAATASAKQGVEVRATSEKLFLSGSFTPSCHLPCRVAATESFSMTYDSPRDGAIRYAQLVMPPPELAGKPPPPQIASTIALIRETAWAICGIIPLDGTGGNLKLSADASAELNGLLNSLFSAKVGGQTEYDKQQYSNVLRQDLPAVIHDNINCRQAVFHEMFEKLVH